MALSHIYGTKHQDVVSGPPPTPHPYSVAPATSAPFEPIDHTQDAIDLLMAEMEDLKIHINLVMDRKNKRKQMSIREEKRKLRFQGLREMMNLDPSDQSNEEQSVNVRTVQARSLYQPNTKRLY